MSKVLNHQRRVAREGDEEHWIPLSDLMTTLMFLFLLIAIAYMVQVQAQQSTRTQKVVDAFVVQRSALYEALEHEFGADFDRWNAELTPDLTIRFHQPTVAFNRGSARIEPRFASVLRDFFPRYVRILENPRYRALVKELRLEGTASPASRLGGSPGQAYIENMALSQDRSRAVLGFVLPLAKVKPHLGWLEAHVTADGLSSSHPLSADGRNDAARSELVQFRIVDTLSDRVQQAVEVPKEQLPPRLLPMSVLPRHQETPSGFYSIDAVVVPDAKPVIINLEPHPVVAVKREEPVKIVGWATNRAGTSPARAVYANIDGKNLILAEYGSIRDDVAEKLRNATLNHVGFTIDIPAYQLTPGKHDMTLIVVDPAEKAYFVAPRHLILTVE